VIGTAAETHERSETAAAICALFRDELYWEAADWERQRSVPRDVYERLAAIDAFRERWADRSTRIGRLELALVLAAEAARVSIGGSIALASHSEGFLGTLQQSPYGREVADDALSGKLIGAMAISEPTSGSDVTHCETRAERSSDGWVISGTKLYVSNIPPADECLVFARSADRGTFSDFSLFLVPTTARGFVATPHELVGSHASGTHVVELEEVAVPPERLVGRAGTGLAHVLDFLRLERAWAAAACTAIAELCFEMALAYARERVIAGRPLTDHQAIAHRLADMSTRVEAARLMVRSLLDGAGRGELSSARSAQAKLMAARTAWDVGDETMQILGGRGYTAATPFHRIWSDLRVARIGGGTDEVLRDTIARDLRPGELAAHPDVQAVRAAASTPSYVSPRDVV